MGEGLVYVVMFVFMFVTQVVPPMVREYESDKWNAEARAEMMDRQQARRQQDAEEKAALEWNTPP